MKIRIFPTVIFVLLAIVSSAQSTWTIIPSDTDVCLNSVDFFDNNNGIIVGDKGIILMTSDGGSYWKSKNSGVTNCLNSVSYFDVNCIMAVGADGLILKSNDEGNTWQIVNIELIKDANLLSVHISQNGNGIIGGSSKTLLITRDCGDSWRIVSKDGEGNFNSVRIFDEETAFVFGDNTRKNHVIGKVLNFNRLTISREYKVFNDNYYSEGKIIDGYPINSDSIITIGIMNNSDNQEPRSYIARSDQWITDMWAPVASTDSTFYTGLDMDNMHGIAVGGRISSKIYGNAYLISETYNQGQNWIDVSSPAGCRILKDVKLISNTAFIVGDSGLIMKAQFPSFKKLSNDFDYRAGVYPDPSMDVSSFIFYNPIRQKATIALYSSKGKLTRRIFSGNLQAGLQEFVIPIKQLRKGTYDCMMIIGDQRVSSPLQVI